MAKCKGCSRRGLFLKLQNGLCESCLDKLFPTETGPFGLTKDMFLNPEKHAVEDEPLKRDTQKEAAGIVIAQSGSKIPIDLLPTFYDLSGIKIIDNNYYEITSSENIERAKADAERLNEYIDKAKRRCRTLPDFRFRKELLNFKFNSRAFTRNYCMLSFAPLTKTGKVSSLPMDLHINQGEYFHGKIYYDATGNIGRAEISMLTVKVTSTATTTRQDCRSHEIILTKQNGALDIRLIYRSDGGYRKKIYDSKQT